MNELEKCIPGKYYNCHDPIFLDFKARENCCKFTMDWHMDKKMKKEIF